ncbi:MAG: AAA family ATPase [Flavobacteriaceae bacterium]|nr:AAA family ATPase [Flavobacteriaceae bacterium]
MNKSIYLLILFSLFSNEVNSQEEKFLDYYSKAKTATFYSSKYLNSYHDLQYAKKYLDSAKTELKLIDKSNSNYDKYLFNISSLNSEINSSESISSENINYNIPHFSFYAGYRDDYVNPQDDDPEEILIENLITKQLNQQDPILRGNLIDNTQFLIVTLEPFNEIHLGTANDLINSSTSHYTIRPHEIAQIIGQDGYERYKASDLSADDWSKILEYYKTDKIYNFKIEDRGSIKNDNLFYKGITFNIVDLSSNNTRFIRYFENFKISKVHSVNNTILNLIIVFLLFIIIVFIGNEKLKNIKNQFLLVDNRLSNLIIAFVVIISVNLLTPLLTKLFIPSINAYLSNSYPWILVKALSPIFISAGLVFPLHFKFSKISSSSEKSFKKIIYAVLCSPIILNAFYISYSKLNIGNFDIDLLSILSIVGLYVPSRALGTFVFKIIRKIYRTLLFNVFSIILIIFYLTLVFAYQFNSSSLFYLLISVNIISIFILRFSNIKTLKNEIESSSLGKFLNPYQYLTSGFNYKDINDKLKDFISNNSEIVLYINGNDGLGKTRLLRNFVETYSKEYEFFYGDFNEFKDGAQKMYQPFYEAFCLSNSKRFDKDNEIYLDEEFFSDRSTAFSAIIKFTKTALDSAPINLGEIITVENNESLSVNEISNELVDYLINEVNEKCVIIIDEYQWVDKATNELIVSLIEKAKIRGKKSSIFKIILVTSNDLIDTSSDYNTCIKETLATSSNKDNSIEFKLDNKDEFLIEFFESSGFKYFSNNEKIYFSNNFKDHLIDTISSSQITFTPKNLFSYIQALDNNEYIKLEGQTIRLKKVPEEDFTYEDSSNNLMKSKFQSLTEKHQKLIESASHIGFKFDASILSYIWKEDFINIIDDLEKIEQYGLLEDNLDQDNMYEFKSKSFHKWLRSNYDNEDNELHNQRVIEIQKRIIDSVVSNGDEYIQNLDIDVLKSISNRCNKFSKVDGILTQSIHFNLITALRLSRINKISQSLNYIENVQNNLYIIDENQVDLIIDTIGNYFEYSDNLSMLDKINESKLYDEIFMVLLKRSNDYQRSKSVLFFLLDLYRRRNDKNYKESQKRQERVDKINQSKSFIIDEDKIRMDFYLALNSNPDDNIVLNNLRKSALARKDYQLYGEILRQLSINYRKDGDLNNMFECICKSLLVENNSSDIEITSKNSVLSFDKVKLTINSILKNTSIKHNKAKNLSYLLSRFSEYYYIQKEYSNSIWICKNAIDLNKNLGEYMGLVNNYIHIGASLLHVKKIDKAEKVYKDYYDLLIKKGTDKKFFIPVFEGLLYCANEKKDYSIYENLKNDFYEHLMFISFEMREKPIIDSIIDKNVKLKDLETLVNYEKSNKRKVDKIDEAFIENIFKLLYLISKVDGTVDDKELYDLKESVYSVSQSLGINSYVNDDQLNNLSKKLNSIESLDDIRNEFEKTLKVLTENKYHEKGFLKSIYNFIEDISKADGILDIKEKELIKVANKYLLNDVY